MVFDDEPVDYDRWLTETRKAEARADRNRGGICQDRHTRTVSEMAGL